MNFQQNHEPACFDDLVFHDPNVEQLLREYAEGKRNEHLILHGSFGSGKSSAVRMIRKELTASVDWTEISEPLNGRTDKKRSDWRDIENEWRLHKIAETPPIVQIDEVDKYKKGVRSKISTLLQSDMPGTLLMTTNRFDVLEEWLVVRCLAIEIKVPQGNDYLLRARAILRAEGHELNEAAVKQSLSLFKGSLRDLTRFLETQVIRAG